MQSYQLVIRVSEPVSLTVGKLGVFEFPVGEYIYTGSAKRHLEARIRRHLRTTKTLKWHIDYLLAHPAVAVVDVIRSTVPECELNQQTAGEILIPRFGASDCRSGCISHLKYRK
ncbi:MAG: GIY-YIG nuclease family protein [Gemmatimonadetes bacterium]|nr:MAG: GIY-YIG nuclease family protein [Gemmatimonadota bacterium]